MFISRVQRCKQHIFAPHVYQKETERKFSYAKPAQEHNRA